MFMKLIAAYGPKPCPQFVRWLALAGATVVMAGCGGGESIVGANSAVTPAFSSLTAASMKVGVASTLTVTGTNLPLTATLTLASGSCASPTNNTATGFSIVCTPTSSTAQSATVWSAPQASGGYWLGQQTLTVAAATGLMPLNDTGISATQCFQSGSNNLISCTLATATALNDKQDGMVGRDVDFTDQTDGVNGSSLAFPGAVTNCVKDQVTGLVWDRASTALTSALPTGYRDESVKLATAANTSSLCGLTNWRVPTRLELQSLVLFNAPFASGATNMAWFPATLPNAYFSSSVYQPNSANNAWLVNFAQGATVTLSGAGAGAVQVRLVSGGITAPATRFTPSSDGTEVTDAITGLLWRRCSEGQTWNGSTCTGTVSAYTHEGAMAQAKSQSTWRLPNVKELSSLTDESLYSPSIDTTVFAASPAGAFWSATPVVISGNTRSDQAWSVDFLDGSVTPVARSTATGFVRLVR